MARVRTALIGCGKVGGIHAAALATLEEAELVAVCDASAERAGAFADRYYARPFTDVAALLRDVKPDVVLIATPHPLHAAPAILAAEAGAHVLVEKPMAATLSDCDAMLAAAAKSGVQLGVISQRRFYEPVQRMRAAIDAGKIGRPALGLFLMYSWRDPSYYTSDPWRGRWDTEGGGVLVNQSPHQFDLLRWFLGPVAEVSGYWANLNHPTVEVDDTAVAILRFENGGLGSIVTSVSQKPGIYTKLHVHGTNGASVGVETDHGSTFIAGMTGIAEPPLNDVWTIPGEEQLLAEFQAADRARFQTIDAIAHYHALQFRDFFQAIRDNRPPLVTGEDGRAVVELFTAIYQSNRERRAVRLPLWEHVVEELGIPGVLLDYAKGLKTRDVDRIAFTVADDLALITPGRTLNKPQFLAMLRAIYAGFPDWHYEQQPPEWRGDMLAIKWRQGGTHTAMLAIPGLPSVAATGQCVQIAEHYFFYRVRDDKLIEIRPEAVPGGAPWGILEQLGVKIP